MTEPNFRIQITILALSIYLGNRLGLVISEWLNLITVLGLLLIVELLNTVIEEIMDHFMEEKSEVVKVIKDLSAAAVLITSFVVLTNLILIFGPKFWS